MGPGLDNQIYSPVYQGEGYRWPRLGHRAIPGAHGARLIEAHFLKAVGTRQTFACAGGLGGGQMQE